MDCRRRAPAIVALASALLLYVLLALWVRRYPESPSELALLRRIQTSTPPTIGRFLHWVSWLGFPPQSVLLPGAVIAAFWWRGHRPVALELLTSWTPSAVSFVTKRLVRRPRPNHPSINVPVRQPGDASYPSGHVVTYTAFWLAALTALAERAPWTWVRGLLRVCAGLLVATVGLSRMYLGHHWLTDVIGGYLLGGSWYGLVRLLRCAGERAGSCET